MICPLKSAQAILVLTSSWRESSGATARLTSALQQNGMSLFGATDVSGWPGLRGRGRFWNPKQPEYPERSRIIHG